MNPDSRNWRYTPTPNEKALEESFDIKRQAMVVLDLIVAEFNSDPMSVQCFDLRTVARAQELIRRWKALPPHIKE